MSDLSRRLADRAGAARRALRAAISATGLVHRRAEFGWTIRPARGSVLASTRPGRWNPEPDYVYHWARDAAVAMRRVPALAAAATTPEKAEDWRRAFAEFVRFSLETGDPARPALAANPLAPSTRPEARRFLRPDDELAALGGDALLGEPRVGADGTPDLERWSRPQFDGPALRAAAVLAAGDADAAFWSDDAARLAARDLAFTVERAGEPCVGPWEEPPPRRHLFTLIAQWDALTRAKGRGLAEEHRLAGAAARVAAAAREAQKGGLWRAHVGAGPDDLDAAVIVAAVEADRADGPFALTDPALAATADRLEADFAALYPVNAAAPGAPMIGRWTQDAFFGGNPWLPTTLAFATLRYRRATLLAAPEEFARGERLLARLCELTPDGGFPEQLDRATGAPVSCRALTWSAAAFLAAVEARGAAQATLSQGL